MITEWYQNWTDVTPDDLEAVQKFLSMGTLSVVNGGVLGRFEKRFAKFCGVKHAVAFHNGTSAIYSALKACGVGSGDDVLVCEYGFHGMAAAVLATGARIVPVDCLATSLCMDPADLARARTPESKAVLVHNPWGMPADYRALREAAEGLRIVADASHAHGAEYRGEPIACGADIACFSLGFQKLISGGELGCAVTTDLELKDRMMLRGHVNRVPSALKSDVWHGNAIDLKMRPHPVALILASGQLKRYPEKRERLVETCGRIEESLRQCGFQPQSTDYEVSRVWWKIVLRRPDGMSKEEAELGFRLAGVPLEANHYDPPLQRQAIFEWPEYRGRLLGRECPVTTALCTELVTLPAPVQLERLRVENSFFKTAS
jgi:dTDP-4-amino-4,6-dideoxygalactose transaminase